MHTTTTNDVDERGEKDKSKQCATATWIILTGLVGGTVGGTLGATENNMSSSSVSAQLPLTHPIATVAVQKDPP